MIDTICKYFFWFVLYSFGGWVVETLLYIIRDKKVVKRGFLFGPVCPIYGVAAIICNVLLYGRVNNVFIVFIIGFFLTGLIEYITHFVMEKLFHAMWWDYSNRRLNLNGRVYLKGLVIFGLGVDLIVFVIQPFVVKLTDLLDDNVLYIICFAVYSVLIVDLSATISDLKGTIKAIKNFQSEAIGKTQKGIDLTSEQLEIMKSEIQNSPVFKKAISENKILKRIKQRYPDFTLTKYKYIIDLINDPPMEEKSRNDIKLYGTADSIPEKEEK